MNTKKLLSIILSSIFAVSLFLFGGCAEKQQFSGLSVSNLSVTYDQRGHVIEVMGIENYPDAKLTYSLNGKKYSFVDAQQFDAGEYNYVITVSQKGYKDLILNCKMLINKATPWFKIDQKDNILYTGNPVYVDALPNVELENENFLIEYLDDNGNVLAYPPKEVGDYKLRISIGETKNYLANSEVMTYSIRYPVYSVNIKILNPLTNELEDAIDSQTQKPALATYMYSSELSREQFITYEKEFDGFTVDGWYVLENEETLNYTQMPSAYNYFNSVTFVLKYKPKI